LKRGELFVISAPSGAGKTTVLKRIFSEVVGIAFSVSHTTRKPRDGEENGRDYHFVERQEFVDMREAGLFLEWAEVHGNLYGTSREVVETLMSQGIDVILDIDVQGARQIRVRQGLNSHYVFITPPSWEELQKRLAGRGTETAESLRTREENARREIADMASYDFLIINDTIDRAVEMLRSIIIAQRSRARRSITGHFIDLAKLYVHVQT
jgi:guanylate kinase